VSQRRQPRLPPGVHRLGNARSAVSNAAGADAYALAVGPLATLLQARGLSLRAIGHVLAQGGVAPRRGGLGRPLSANTVKRRLHRYRHLDARSQLQLPRGSCDTPPPQNRPFPGIVALMRIPS
jgi:hypothetical protein